ncbi:hypothetical protein KMW28_24235 [Flammeovirga yaeyamensis]|uniref:Uncharacterized protein n=1 Tax=Flammeovirga yaeyamensis TaxID=367791 RepID=A0AAX1NDF1_9BACT|nr:hypothetical protein [Flammeovirga yaeyamensis]MBB3696508.1 hypothetical protein [Flammeovirga yaeyamensis]NMF33188.1 hypothetical protein [Flammeovirga yaeyamensis]QWG05532.1 hypothetical protein KMW28_24235 [Flammeovirga yaeyamensis]
MNTDILIKSKLFSAYPNEELDINPGRFGKKLGEFVSNALKENNIETADLYPTDYCYELRIDQYEFKVYILTGNIDGTDNEFLISIEPKKEYIRKWFRKISTVDIIMKIQKTINDACKDHPDIEVL